MSAVTDLEHEARDAAYVELVADLREQAREADGMVGVPGFSASDLRRTAAAFEMVAGWVEREYLGHELAGTHGHARAESTYRDTGRSALAAAQSRDTLEEK